MGSMSNGKLISLLLHNFGRLTVLWQENTRTFSGIALDNNGACDLRLFALLFKKCFRYTLFHISR